MVEVDNVSASSRSGRSCLSVGVMSTVQLGEIPLVLSVLRQLLRGYWNVVASCHVALLAGTVVHTDVLTVGRVVLVVAVLGD